jgi:prepilin-type N-terminal cleavage/methylation domain-containing protein
VKQQQLSRKGIHSGVTLVELLAVIAIVVVLAALFYPVLAGARGEAHKTVCISNLRQLSTAISLYRGQHGGDAVTFGDLYSMGLPPPRNLTDALASTRSLWKCDGPSRRAGHVESGFSYTYIPAPPGERIGATTWAEYVQTEGEAALLFTDLYHSPAGTDLSSPVSVKRGIAVTLAGNIVRKTKAGLPGDFDWWK